MSLNIFTWLLFLPIALFAFQRKKHETYSDSIEFKTEDSVNVLFSENEFVSKISVDEAFRLLEESKFVTPIDLRPHAAYADGHIKGAKNIDISTEEGRSALLRLRPARAYIVYAAGIHLNTDLLETLIARGCSALFHMYEGYSAWAREGYPIVSG